MFSLNPLHLIPFTTDAYLRPVFLIYGYYDSFMSLFNAHQLPCYLVTKLVCCSQKHFPRAVLCDLFCTLLLPGVPRRDQVMLIYEVFTLEAKTVDSRYPGIEVSQPSHKFSSSP
jgi:hypothetical protein